MEQKQDGKISIILPTLNIASGLAALLSLLHRQTRLPDKILVIDSESNDDTLEIAKRLPLVRVLEVKRSEFDHGDTRDFAFRAAIGNIVLFFTQYAISCDDGYVEVIVQAVKQSGVTCACARQIARANAPLYEQFTRDSIYPKTSFIRDQGDISKLGVKVFFFSDSCLAYRRDAYLAIGDFDHPVLTNEDIFVAAKFLSAVFHSHQYTIHQEYERNCKIGFVLEQHQDRFNGASAESEGIRYLRQKLECLLQQYAFKQFVRFCFLCAARVIGNQRERSLARYSSR